VGREFNGFSGFVKGLFGVVLVGLEGVFLVEIRRV